MGRPAIVIKKFAIFCHRWMGVTFCVLFLWWFVSGIFMMYWDYPSISERDRLQRAPALDATQVKVSPADAYAALQNDQQPGSARLASFDGRPAYYFRFGRDSAIVYADTGELQDVFSPEVNLRTAAAWTHQSATSAKVESMDAPDQWTLEGRLRTLALHKYSFPDGQQVYVADDTGEVVQYTTTSARIFAYLGAIPHWLYFTPLRVNGKMWSQVVIWSSGLATVAALLGLTVGLWMYSPSKKYRHEGAATGIPYIGQKRLHTQLGLFFGILACTWAFSGMLSMDPFPLSEGPSGQSKGQANNKGKTVTPAARIQNALTGGRFQLSRYEAKHPAEALKQLDMSFGAAGNPAQEAFGAKQLEFASFAGEPVFLAWNGLGQTKIVPVEGQPASDFGEERIVNLVSQAAQAENISELRLIRQYDRYYLDRSHQAPLPVVYVKLKDEAQSRLYIDPKTGRTVARYSNSTAAWVERWLYHGLHSFNFPWLYNYRPAWDIVVLGLMGACTWLCVTSLILAWRVVRGKIRKSSVVAM